MGVTCDRGFSVPRLAALYDAFDKDVEIARTGESNFPGIFVAELHLDETRFERRERLLGFSNHARVNATTDSYRSENATFLANPHLRALAFRTRAARCDERRHSYTLFRLGQLLMEDGQHVEAVKSFDRTLELSPQFSKVYQLLGECHAKLGDKARAVEVLTTGYKVADERGDKMPRDAMAKLLTDLGAPVPAAQAAVDLQAIVDNISFGQGYLSPMGWPNTAWFFFDDPAPTYDPTWRGNS